MASTVNLTMDQGATYSYTLTLLDNDGTSLVVDGYTANAAMRKHWESANSTTFTTALSNGSLTISLTSTQTALLDDGKHVYEVKITNAANTVTRIMEGLVTVKPGVV